MAKFVLNQEVICRAWWTIPEGKPVRCRVEQICGIHNGMQFYEVRPVEGNTHLRYVRETELV